MENNELTPSRISVLSLPAKTKWIIIACAIYLALPFDVIPGVGLVGDLSALFVALNALKKVSARQEV